MQYYRCQCGKSQSWSSMSQPPCRGCPECNTTLELSPEFHKTPKPHQYVTRYDETTGEPYQICLRCLDRPAKEVAVALITVTLEQLNSAFDKAENETADQYNSQVCSMNDRDGNDTCPICYFRQQVKKHLGIEVSEG